jgi:YVTN family beta-propeller protein
MPEGIEASRDGETLYVANWMDDTVSVVDARNLTVTATLPAGDSPRAFGTFLRSTGQGPH